MIKKLSCMIINIGMCKASFSCEKESREQREERKCIVGELAHTY